MKSNNPTDLESAELYLSRECYGNNIVVINNAYMKRYHLRSFSNSGLKIEHLSLNNPNHIPIIKDKLKDENNDALLSASYEFVRQNNWHCTPIGCDNTGFYLIQTSSGLNDYEDIANLANFGSVTNIVNPGDCLLIYKEPTQG